MQQFQAVFYNVENLFPPDVPGRHRTDPGVSGLRGWNDYRYKRKIRQLGDVFRELFSVAEPLLIGLCEIYSIRPLQDLLNTEAFGEEWSYLYFDSADPRGIAVALLYNSDLLQLQHSETIGIEYAEPGRDILHAEFIFNDHPLHVFVLHLPSQRQQNRKRHQRIAMLEALANKIKSLNNAPVLILGDFNVNPDSDELQKFRISAGPAHSLYNPFESLFPEKRFSTWHYGEGLLFDQLLFSSHFINSQFPLQFHKAGIFNAATLQQRHGAFSVRPLRTFAGTRYLGGCSDHFPVTVTFKSSTE